MVLRRVRTETFGTPVMIEGEEYSARVVIHCGCSLFIGENGLMGRPCSGPHQAIIDLALARACVIDEPASALLDAESMLRPAEQLEEERKP